MRGAFQRSTRLTLNLYALTRLYPTRIRSHAVQLRIIGESISDLEWGIKEHEMETDLGSCSFDFECHGLDIVIRDRKSAFYGLSKRP